MRATLEARRDLGPEYETALLESFVDRVQATIADRVRAEVEARLGPPLHPASPPYPPYPARHQPQANRDTLWIALISLGAGIPLSGIAAATAGWAGLLLAWIGIVAINIIGALARR